MDQNKIGEFIKKLRTGNHLTQKEFADKYGVTYQAVSKWENGKNLPDMSLIKQMSEDFNIGIDELLDGEKKKKRQIDYKYLKGAIFGSLIIVFMFFIFWHATEQSMHIRILTEKPPIITEEKSNTVLNAEIAIVIATDSIPLIIPIRF